MTVVTGENGAGKTSLLEAIAYLSRQESLRGSPREALVRTGCDRAVVRAEITNDDRATLLEAEIAPPRRDVIQRNRQRITRVRDLLETFQVTVFSPDDLTLVKEGPAERRRYLDDVLVASAPRHLPLRQAVERILRQRAVLLRQAGGRLTPDIVATLDVWDEQLARAGEELTSARETLVVQLSDPARDAFRRLTNLEAPLTLHYERSYSGALGDALLAARGEDVRRATTGVGPHRDELVIALGDLDTRTRVSQGRQRAVTLALRLAAHEVVTDATGSRPILLLDDAFSELDEATAAALVGELPAGQAILTTAGALPSGLDAAAVHRLEAGVLV